MFDGIINFFNSIPVFLAQSGIRVVIFVTIIILIFVAYMALRLIIDANNGDMNPKLKAFISILILLVVFVGGYFGIKYAIILCSGITDFLT